MGFFDCLRGLRPRRRSAGSGGLLTTPSWPSGGDGRPGLLQRCHARPPPGYRLDHGVVRVHDGLGHVPGGAALARRGGHMTITELLEKLSAPSRRKADAIIQVFCLAILLILVWYGMESFKPTGQHADGPRMADGPAIPGAAGRLGGHACVRAHDFVQIVRGKSREERYGG